MTSLDSSSGLAIILSAPSGTGKTTVCSLLKEWLPHLNFKISHTTRKPRPDEEDGVDYHFISDDEFKKGIKEKLFLEWAKVHGVHYYGTLQGPVLKVLQSGADLIMEMDVQGTEALRKAGFPGVYIQLLPPTLKDLKTRLVERGTEDSSAITRRLKTAKEEIARTDLYDYLVTNDDLEETVETLISIMNAERHRRERFVTSCKEIASLINQKASG